MKQQLTAKANDSVQHLLNFDLVPEISPPHDNFGVDQFGELPEQNLNFPEDPFHNDWPNW